MKKTFTKLYTEDGRQYKITAEVRFDDECKNGHKTFAITGEILREAKMQTVQHSFVSRQLARQ